MAFFSHEVTRDKLSILYILNLLDIGLTRQQCIDIMLVNGWANYFNVVTALTELEEESLIAAIPRPYGQAYRITQEAREALEMFKARIPITLRNAYEDYIRENRERLTRETQVIATMHRESQGSYMVDLKVVEMDRVLLEISIGAPSKAHAQAACDAWPAAAEGIYANLVGALMSREEPKMEEESETERDEK